LWLADAFVPPLEAYPKVRDAAVQALQLNDQEAEAHVYLAESKRILDWDLNGAEAEFNRAVEIEPNSTPSNYFIAAFHAARGDRALRKSTRVHWKARVWSGDHLRSDEPARGGAGNSKRSCRRLGLPTG